MILTQALNQAALKNVNNTAIADLDKTISYGELKNRIAQLSYLYQTELPAKEPVAFLTQNCAAVIYSFFALSNTNNPIYFIDPKDSNETIANDLRNLNINTILATNNYLSRVADLQRSFNVVPFVIELEKRKGGEYDKSFTTSPERPLKESDQVLILKCGSDDDESKYIYFNHKKIYAASTAIRKFYKLTANDRILTTMNWQHPFALTHGMLLPLLYGATCAVDPQCPTVEEFVEFIAKNKISRFIGPPKFYFQLLNLCASQKYTLPGVKSITIGMGTISLSLRKIYQMLKIPVLRCYGRTEAVWSLAMDSVETALDIESAKSQPVSGVSCKVLDAAGDEIPGPGVRVGPLAILAEAVMDKMFHPDKKIAEEATRQKLRGTWLYTDEIARLEGEDDELTIAVLGKEVDMIFENNQYLSPKKIDDIARAIPNVQDAAGFVQIDRFNEKSFACAVVLENRKMKESEILQMICSQLPKELKPIAIYVVEDIPRDAFESPNRQALQRQLSNFN